MRFCNKPIRYRPRSKLLAWVALAAFALGASPRAGCFCADGHYEFFCQSQAADAGGSGCCSCCTVPGHCCRTSGCCQGHTDSGGAPAGGVVKAPQCCLWVLSVPSAAKKESDSELVGWKVPAMVLVTAELLPAIDRPDETGASRVNHTVLPAIDLVIALQRLTI